MVCLQYPPEGGSWCALKKVFKNCVVKRRMSLKTDERILLPICKYKDELLASVSTSQCVVITGQTGCGKTTQLPQFLRDAGLAEEGAIAVTQPRRVAAISVAHRVAFERNAELGGEVGYQVRFDDCSGPRTKIKYMTDGCLLREFLEDQELSRYTIIVLDEAHERSLATDILFGLSKNLLDQPFSFFKRRKKPLKVVIMSATLDVSKFSNFFSCCPTFEIPGRVFPVSIFYNVSDESFDTKKLTYISQLSRVVMDIHLDHPKGDILVFLTGQSEIENACNRIFKAAEDIDYNTDVASPDVRGMLILPLYGALSTEQQQKVFNPVEDNIRRVVVATNIAATSLTIDGVVYVVDSGFVKQLSYNPRTGLDSLEIVPIAQSEATQRCGRAGRTSPGKCYRLYSKKFFDQMDECTVPEIQRTSLARVVLNLKCMGIYNVLDFQYLDPPQEKMVLDALRQLYYYQAINKDGGVTKLGRQLVEFPLQPSLARVLIRARELDCCEAVIPVVAMLSVENVFVRPSNKQESEAAMEAHRRIAEESGGTSDFSTLLAIYKFATSESSFRKWCRDNFVHWRAIKTARSIHQQLETILARQRIPRDKSTGPSVPLGQRVRQALCYGLFHNVARVSPSRRSFRTMDGHSTVAYIHPASVLFSQEKSLDWVLYMELVDTARTYMRTICPISYSWVKDLLPQLHNVDVYRLTGCQESAAKRGREEAGAGGDSVSQPEEHEPPAKKQELTEAGVKLADRAEAAKLRYLARKSGV